MQGGITSILLVTLDGQGAEFEKVATELVEAERQFGKVGPSDVSGGQAAVTASQSADWCEGRLAQLLQFI
jgi:hypothetical protein